MEEEEAGGNEETEGRAETPLKTVSFLCHFPCPFCLLSGVCWEKGKQLPYFNRRTPHGFEGLLVGDRITHAVKRQAAVTYSWKIYSVTDAQAATPSI